MASVYDTTDNINIVKNKATDKVEAVNDVDDTGSWEYFDEAYFVVYGVKSDRVVVVWTSMVGARGRTQSKHSEHVGKTQPRRGALRQDGGWRSTHDKYM